MGSMEFFRNQSGVRLSIDELRQLIEHEAVEQVAELIILLDEMEIFEDDEEKPEAPDNDFPFDLGTFFGIDKPEEPRPPRKE